MAYSASSNPKFKVALVQMKPKPVDPEFNFNHAASQIRVAAEQGASLAVLPEYHLTAWEPEHPEFTPIARTAHQYQRRYQDLAKELKINICPGTIVQTPQESDTTANGTSSAMEINADDKPSLLNISSFISYTGELLGTYTKTNLWIPEREHLTSSIEHAQSSSPTTTFSSASGNPSSQSQTRTKPQSQSQTEASTGNPARSSTSLLHAGIAHDEPKPTLPSSSACGALSSPHNVIETPLGPVGILICWDLAFPEAFRHLIMAGAKIIIIPTFWTAFDMSAEGLAYNKNAEKLFLESTLVCRAFENTAAMIFVNAGGPVDEGFLGLSQVALPLVGKVDGSFDDGEEGVRVVEVDMNTVEVAERNYRVREDLGGDGWHYGYKGGRITSSS